MRDTLGSPVPYADLVEFFETSIPFNKVLGMLVDEIEHGTCRLRIPFHEGLIGDPERPALHGGVISTLADAAGGLAVFSTFDGFGTSRTSTVDLRVDYLLPGRSEDVCCDARVIRAGNRVAVTSMVVHHGDPTQAVAEARGVYNVTRQ